MSQSPDTPREVSSLLRQLETFSPVENVRGGTVTEVGLAEDEDGLHLLAFVPTATEVRLLGPDKEARAVLVGDEGLLTVEIPRDEQRVFLAVDDGAIEVRTAMGSAGPVQGLTLVREALELGRIHDATSRLRELAHEHEHSPVRARLALDAAGFLEDRTGAIGSVAGSCDTVLAWRSWVGIVRVTALPRGQDPTGRAELDSELMSALAHGGRLGQALGRRARRIYAEPATSAAALQIDATPAAARLSDPGGMTALAAALAACSLTLGSPLPEGTLAVGALDDDGRVLPLDRQRLALVVDAVRKEHPGARLVLPSQNAADARGIAGGIRLLPAATLHEAAEVAFGELRAVAGAAPPELAQVLDDAEVAERAHQPAAGLEGARRFLATGQGTKCEQLRALWLEGACLVHLGRPDEARSTFERAHVLVRCLAGAGELEPRIAVYLAMAQAEAFSDIFRFSDALAALEHGREHAGPSPLLQSKLDAFHGFVLLHAGRADEALVLLWRACARALPADAPRFHCWLAQAHTDLGDVGDALNAARRGLALAERLGGGNANRTYLLLAEARAHLRRLCPNEAIACAEAGEKLASAEPGLSPYPLAGLKHARGAALLLGGRVEEGLTELESGGKSLGPPLIDFVVGLGDVERARALLEREPASSRATVALARAQAVVSGYAPARARFASQLEAMERGGRVAARAMAVVLRTIKY